MKQSVRTKSIETLIKEHNDLAVREFHRLVRHVESLEQQVSTLREIVRHGEQQYFPWFDLPQGEQRHVVAVLEYLRAHPTRSLNAACEHVFENVGGGFRSPKTLWGWCNRHKITMFV